MEQQFPLTRGACDYSNCTVLSTYKLLICRFSDKLCICIFSDKPKICEFSDKPIICKLSDKPCLCKFSDKPCTVNVNSQTNRLSVNFHTNLNSQTNRYLNWKLRLYSIYSLYLFLVFRRRRVYRKEFNNLFFINTYLSCHQCCIFQKKYCTVV